MKRNFVTIRQDSIIQSHFKNGDFHLGLIDGISIAGQQLKKYFPFQADDTNELSNEISIG